mmetsp:Transcript_34480/g.52762  ORF Transcript_34480/g.52762 Transcript_34480/m.52762 type:complete len:90 (+) Transcript_34480:1752-2021(+)
MMKVGERPSMIVLPLNFVVKVGFTYKKVISDLKVATLNKKSEEGSQLNAFYSNMESYAGEKRLKALNYPLKLKPGYAIGLFELVFGAAS